MMHMNAIFYRRLPVSCPVQSSVRVSIFNYVARVLPTIAPIFSCPSRSRANKANSAPGGIMGDIPGGQQLEVFQDIFLGLAMCRTYQTVSYIMSISSDTM
jgi:hypothetical protein